MPNLNTLMLYPSLDIAIHECDKAHTYVASKFPVNSWRIRKSEILICNKYYVRFESALNEQAIRGFRGEIISGNPNWKKVLDDIFEEAIVKNEEEYPSIKILVICTDNNDPEQLTESFGMEMSHKFGKCEIWRGQHTVVVKGRHKVKFGYMRLLEYDLEEFDDVILTPKSFMKYKDRIVEAMK